MNIIYLSPQGSFNPRLFPTFKKTFEEQGHTETIIPGVATHCFLELQSGDVSYNQYALDVLKEKGVPIIAFDSREWGGMKNEKWHPTNFPISIYFVRNMNKEEAYPDNVFPYDWPFFPECDYPLTTKEELNSRPYDCCLISVESPARRNVVDGILKDGRLKLNYKFLDHTERMPYDQWVNEHRKSKLYISCEGGGYSNERPNQLFSVAGQLNVTSNYSPANKMKWGVECLEISEYPTKEEIDEILEVIMDEDWLFDVYTGGVEFTKEKLSEKSVSEYVLNTLKDVGV